MALKITGFTAERMKMIEDKTVVNGSVNKSGDLILSTRDGGQINAGTVMGKSFNIKGRVNSLPSTSGHNPMDAYFVNGDLYVLNEAKKWVNVGGFIGERGPAQANELTVIGAAKNLDDYRIPGAYVQNGNVNTLESNGAKNYPCSSAGYLLVYSIGAGATSWVLQLYVDFSTLEIYVRSLYINVWKPWSKASQSKITETRQLDKCYILKQGHMVVIEFYGTTAKSQMLPEGFKPNRNARAILMDLSGVVVDVQAKSTGELILNERNRNITYGGVFGQIVYTTDQ